MNIVLDDGKTRLTVEDIAPWHLKQSPENETIYNPVSKDDPGFLEGMVQKIFKWTNDEWKLQIIQKQIEAFHKDWQECERKFDQKFKETEKLDGESDEGHQERRAQIMLPWESPTDLLDIPDCHTSGRYKWLTDSVNNPKKHKQKIPSEKLLQADCVLLVILHDKTFEDTRNVNSISADIWPEDEGWVVDHWNQMQHEMRGYWSIRLNRLFARAFMSVESHFAQVLPIDHAADSPPKERTEVKINRNNFNKGRSRELLEGLIINPDGVPGSLQDSRNLKTMLKHRPEIAKDIHKKSGENIIYLKNIRLKEEKIPT